ncbi:DUF6624 domain-containing protein [Shewanella surugensis]|uniref:Lipoprotein n=1 Tax=Shewanella surugensis TaxID=212020 RepID=A0ABT0LJP4_9GAMM|nr:DUF6624 domain-containing protein [Shewanella surugensis]MCL1127919.1 hypothetical protein [Shewanella surugensis]
MIRFFFIALLFTQGCTSTTLVNDEEKVYYLPLVRKELLDMKERDQAARFKFMRNKRSDYDSQVNELDIENTEKLKIIIKQHGKLEVSNIGKDGLEAVSLILIHSPDTNFQEEMLPFIKKLYSNGALEGQDYALLFDKILVHKGIKQYYGTQFIFKNGKYIPDEIENESNVDLRRKDVGLPSLSEYSILLNEFYLNK